MSDIDIRPPCRPGQPQRPAWRHPRPAGAALVCTLAALVFAPAALAQQAHAQGAPASKTEPARADGARPGVMRVTLRHDPFSRPAMPAAAPPGAPTAAPTAASTGARAAAAGAAPLAGDAAPQPEWRPRLRAVVVAGARSLALVGAELVELGGSVEGYRLQSVSENGAVFTKGRQSITLVLGEKTGSERAGSER